MTEANRSSTDLGALILQNRHTGEYLELRRFQPKAGDVWLEIRGSLPPEGRGPPLHKHLCEDEGGTVIIGKLAAIVNNESIVANAGESAFFPRGSYHRWWNPGETKLEFVGFVRPVVDLDRFLQAVFEVVNAGPENRPSLFYMAHVLRRHRVTQAARLMPPAVQGILFECCFWIGTLFGFYRGTTWPGCPEKCIGAPTFPEPPQR